MFSANKVLITDQVAPLLVEGLTVAGYQCDLRPKAEQREVESIISDYKGLIINSKININEAFFSLAPALKFIARLGSGLEIIDVKAAKKHGVAVHRSAEGNCDAVAEHALAMLLGLKTNLYRANSELRQAVWQR